MTTKSPLIVCLESSQNLLKGIERFQRANPDIVQLKTDLEATVKNLEFLQLQQVSGHVDELTDLSVTLLNCAVGIQSLAITTDFRNASLQNEIGSYSDEIAIFILRKYGNNTSISLPVVITARITAKLLNQMTKAVKDCTKRLRQELNEKPM